jgi:hypothetical protein
MTSPELERLAGLGHLKREPPVRAELEALIRTASARLADARREDLAAESRFDLAYNSAHALALVALRWLGYRPDKRYFVFLALPHTLGLPAKTWRLLAKCHEERNKTEYEGLGTVDETLLVDLIAAARELLERVRKLIPHHPDEE